MRLSYPRNRHGLGPASSDRRPLAAAPRQQPPRAAAYSAGHADLSRPEACADDNREQLRCPPDHGRPGRGGREYRWQRCNPEAKPDAGECEPRQPLPEQQAADVSGWIHAADVRDDGLLRPTGLPRPTKLPRPAGGPGGPDRPRGPDWPRGPDCPRGADWPGGTRRSPGCRGGRSGSPIIGRS